MGGGGGEARRSVQSCRSGGSFSIPPLCSLWFDTDQMRITFVYFGMYCLLVSRVGHKN